MTLLFKNLGRVLGYWVTVWMLGNQFWKKWVYCCIFNIFEDKEGPGEPFGGTSAILSLIFKWGFLQKPMTWTKKGLTGFGGCNGPRVTIPEVQWVGHLLGGGESCARRLLLPLRKLGGVTKILWQGVIPGVGYVETGPDPGSDCPRSPNWDRLWPALPLDSKGQDPTGSESAPPFFFSGVVLLETRG